MYVPSPSFDRSHRTSPEGDRTQLRLTHQGYDAPPTVEFYTNRTGGAVSLLAEYDARLEKTRPAA